MDVDQIEQLQYRRENLVTVVNALSAWLFGTVGNKGSGVRE